MSGSVSTFVIGFLRDICRLFGFACETSRDICLSVAVAFRPVKQLRSQPHPVMPMTSSVRMIKKAELQLPVRATIDIHERRGAVGMGTLPTSARVTGISASTPKADISRQNGDIRGSTVCAIKREERLTTGRKRKKPAAKCRHNGTMPSLTATGLDCRRDTREEEWR